MRILWVKAGKLLPVDTGGKIRSYNILRHLASRNEITLLSYYGGTRDESYEKEIRRHFPAAVVIYVASGDREGLERVIDYVLHLPFLAPYAVTKFTAKEVRRTVNQWINERKFDVAVCDFLAASLNFPRLLATPVILFQHNVESVLWRRQAHWEANPLIKMFFRLEAFKMACYERRTIRRFHHVIAVSEQDREHMATMTDPSRIWVVPTGVDLKKYRNATAPPPAQPLVVFVGSMDWEANIDSVEYFYRDIWPRVLTRVPSARFRIVGRDPHPRVRRLASDSIQVTGTVASVIDHLREAAVIVVPLRFGGGTRLKIYEAMAMGRAVVSTSLGAEGLEVSHGQDILLADDPASFAANVTMLLQDEETRVRYGMAAAKSASQHDWSIIAERFEQVLKRVAQSSGRLQHI